MDMLTPGNGLLLDSRAAKLNGQAISDGERTISDARGIPFLRHSSQEQIWQDVIDIGIKRADGVGAADHHGAAGVFAGDEEVGIR